MLPKIEKFNLQYENHLRAQYQSKKANTSLGIPRKETETKQKMLVMSLPWCHLSLWPPLCFTECFCCRARASEVVVWGNNTRCWHCFGNSSLKGRIPGIVDCDLIQSFSCFCILITRFHWRNIFQATSV